MPYSDPEKKRLYNAQWAKDNRELANKHQCKSRYGLTLAHLDALLAAQNHECAILTCRKKLIGYGRGPDLGVLDHDHLTGKPRGIICQGCNTGIGKLGDGFRDVLGAVAYLIAGNEDHLKEAIELLTWMVNRLPVGPSEGPILATALPG